MTELQKAIYKNLQRLRPDLTAQDKAEVLAELGISRTTLDNYFNGRVGNTELGTKLVELITDKIQSRLARLQGAA